MTAPPTRRDGFNNADLRYVRRALGALRHAQGASDQAAAWASDHHVRALARRARAMQEDGIGEMTSLLDGWGRHERGLDGAGASMPLSRAIASSDLASLAGLELDQRFVQSLIAHAEAAIASARTEMIEGFAPSSRRLAQDTIRANSRDLTALNRLVPAERGGMRSPRRRGSAPVVERSGDAAPDAGRSR